MTTNELIKSVSDDRTIVVYVGEGEKQEKFMLQETLLRRTSRVFAAALDNEHLGGGETGVLRFRDDRGGPWKFLVHWMFDHQIPKPKSKDERAGRPDNVQIQLVGCWVLGDKYFIPDFQDLIMLELLLLLNDEAFKKSAVLKAVGETPPGSKLRLLAAREVVYYVIQRGDQIREYEEAMSAVGFGVEIVEEMLRVKGLKFTMRREIGEKKGAGRTKEWQRFMVADGPPKHWIHLDGR